MAKDCEWEDSFSLESRHYLVFGPQILQAAADEVEKWSRST